MPETIFRATVLLAATLLPVVGPRAAEDVFTADAKAGATFWSLYITRDLPGSEQATWAAGGSLWGRTGYWRDFLSFGGAIYGALPIYAPTDRDGAGLLKPGQDGYSVLAEAYAKLKWSEQVLTLYRQPIGTNPQKAEGVRLLMSDVTYLGARDPSTPLSYEAAMVGGPIGDSLRYQAGYVSKVKDANSDRFVSMSTLAGVIDWVTRTSKDAYYRFAAQYSDQRSDGANLLTGQAFKTWSAAVYGEYGWYWLRVYGALAATGEGERIRAPYSFGPFYITERIKTFDRAGEDAALLGTTFDLVVAGLPGFSIELNVANGRNAIDAVTRAALPKTREYDTDFVYRFAKESALPGMQLRFRFATVTEDFGTRVDRTNETRFDVNWAINFN